MIWSSVICLA
jgi:hypothetical protein